MTFMQQQEEQQQQKQENIETTGKNKSYNLNRELNDDDDKDEDQNGIDKINENWKLIVDLVNCDACLKATNNIAKQQYKCKHGLLSHLIDLLESHNKYEYKQIELIIKYIELISKCYISQKYLKKLIEFLKPERKFPYIKEILNCLVNLSKINQSLLFNDDLHQLLYLNKIKKDIKSIDFNGLHNNFCDYLTNNSKYTNHFFDFNNHNSGIIVPTIKKWNGYSFSFHCWIRLRFDYKYIDEKKRRQLYSFYTDNGLNGFEAFFTPDLACLVVCVCIKKEFISVQIDDIDLLPSFNRNNNNINNHRPSIKSLNSLNRDRSLYSDTYLSKWVSIAVVYVPAKGPFSSSQLFVYVNGKLKRECDSKLPSFNEPFTQIRVCGACVAPATSASQNAASASATSTLGLTRTLSNQLSNLKNVFSITSSKSSSKANNEKLNNSNPSSIPNGTQDIVWEQSTCIYGHLSSCFALNDVLTEPQIRILNELGPNDFSNDRWLDSVEYNDLKLKLMFYYSNKCIRDDNCYDLSVHGLHAKFFGDSYSLKTMKDSLNSIGNIQIFYPYLHYLNIDKEYLELCLTKWQLNKQIKNNNSTTAISETTDNLTLDKLSQIDKSSNDEKNLVTIILELIRHLFNNNIPLQQCLTKYNGIAILSLLIQNLSKQQFIDLNFLFVCRQLANEASHIQDKAVLYVIYQYLLFDFRIWNKASYEIRIAHIQYLSTIIKDDKEYFRKNYGVQFILDVLRLYFGKTDQTAHEENTKSLRASFIGLIKYYIQNDVKNEEIDAIFSFLCVIRTNQLLQSDILDMFISLLESPSFNESIYTYIYEQSNCDNFYVYLIQTEVDNLIKDKLFKLIKILVKTKKVPDKLKNRLKIDNYGGYNGLISKMLSNCAYMTTNKIINEQFILNLIETFFLTDSNMNTSSNISSSSASTTPLNVNTSSGSSTITNFDGLWTIISLLTPSNNLLVNCKAEIDHLIKIRLKVCNLIIKYMNTNLNCAQNMVKSIGWQDILCQLLCYTQKCDPQPETSAATAVPAASATTIGLETSSTLATLVASAIEAVEMPIVASREKLETTTESEMKTPTVPPPQAETTEATATPTNERQETIEKPIGRVESIDQQEHYTSTPAAESIDSKRRSFVKSKLHRFTIHTESLSLRSDSTSTKESGNEEDVPLTPLTPLTPTTPNTPNSLSKQLSIKAFNNGTTIYDEYIKINTKDIVISESEVGGSNTETELEIDSDVNKTKLFEKIIYLINKFTWDGISGSNEAAWKERCLIFSSIYRLNKEYDFIKPVDQIQMHILDKYLQRCYTDVKKSGHANSNMFYENAREIIKLVDYFIIRNEHINEISEKFVSIIVSLLDQLHTFNDKLSSNNNHSQSKSSRSKRTKSVSSAHYPAELPKQLSTVSLNAHTGELNNTTDASNGENHSILNTQSTSALLNFNKNTSLSLAPIYDELTETNYLSLHILINLISSHNIDICALACAKINAILHNRVLGSCEEASYLIANIDKIMTEWLDKHDEHHYAFLIPIMKCVVDKSYNLLKMNFQVPNIPLTNVTPTFYEDFKDYCKTDEWRIFIEKQIIPLKEQYLAMIITPCRMNMKIWWNSCYDSLMVTIHKRNRVLGEAKIKFENTVYDNWKQREKREILRFQMHVLNIKRTNLIVQKQLNTILKFFNGERGSWAEKQKEVSWILSNRENRYRMRCKLVENPYSDSHFEASRLRDYSGIDYYNNKDALNNSPTNTDNNTNNNNNNNNSTTNSNGTTNNNDNMKVDIKIEETDEFISNDELLNVATGNGNTNGANGSATTAVNQQTTTTTTTDRQLEDKEKLLISSECELVTMTRTIVGRFELTNKYLYFFDLSNTLINSQHIDSTVINSQTINDNYSGFYASVDAIMNQSYTLYTNDLNTCNDFKISLQSLKEVQLRRYNLRSSALEFFLVDQSNFFLNFNKNARNKIYNKIISMKLPNLQSYLGVTTPADLLKAAGYTTKWINREISNFDYLMELNTIAGRSYNDLSQYPVFPWILSDYKSATLDLANPEIYRDLSRPIGVLNPKFEEYVKQKFESFEDPTGVMKPFHYGTHYSNSANVMHYLIRLEPFTTLHIQLQSNRFDVADRQFHSMESTWQILIENPNDVKELIPEFFYFPEFLENMNKLDLGELQSNKNKVNDVVLPPWAKSPEHFIQLHRKALESDYVSENLNEWIDLIFGYKQQGAEAIKALNVFMHCTYEGAIDVDAINDPISRRATEDMISNFGQTPTQLFKEPHPKRKTKQQALQYYEIVGRPISLFLQLYNLKAYYVEISDKKNPNESNDPIIYINIPRNHTKSFMQQGPTDPLITINHSGVVGIHGWQAYERSMRNLFTFEKDPSLMNDKTKRSVAGPFDPNYEINNKLFAVTHDFKLLVSGGHWDNSLRVFSLTKYRTIAQLYHHSDIVTCVTIDYCGTFVLSGSMDTTCILWQIIQEFGVSASVNPVPIHILYGHTACVTCVDISIELDLAVSGSLDGTVNIHNVRNGQYIKTLQLNTPQMPDLKVINVKLSEHRHILVYSCRAHNTDIENELTKIQQIHILTLYSINGKQICSEILSSPIIDMIISDQYCILAINQSNTRFASNTTHNTQETTTTTTTTTRRESLSHSNSFVAASKIVFKELFELKSLQTMRLKAPIKCLFLTRENSHLLVGLKDEKLIVITSEKPSKVIKELQN